jgi:hypothetical protein
MRMRIAGCTVALAAAGLLAGCAPGPGGYAAYSNYRQNQARQDASLANKNAAAAQWQAEHGDNYGAQQSQAAANAAASAAQDEQAHANRDRLLSGF